MDKNADQKQGSASDKNGGSSESWVNCEKQLDPWQAPLCELPVTLAYSAVVDVRNVECAITESMVIQACQDIEAMQQFPFAPRKSAQVG